MASTEMVMPLEIIMPHLASYFLEPSKIICSGNRTIVFWADGTKTIVKCGEDERDSLYHAFTAAVCKKLYGSNSAIHKILKDKTLIQANGITVPESTWDAVIKRLRELWGQ